MSFSISNKIVAKIAALKVPIYSISEYTGILKRKKDKYEHILCRQESYRIVIMQQRKITSKWLIARSS